MYKFYLRFDDNKHSLTNENGLDLDEVVKIISTLKDVIISDKSHHCSISGVSGNCYQLEFSTQYESVAEKFKIVHSNIQSKPLSDLSNSEAKYGRAIKSVTKKGRYVEARGARKTLLARISTGDIDREVEHYYTISSVVGIISEQGGKTLESIPHIQLDGVGYSIKVSNEQDIALSPYYKHAQVEMKLKQKKSANDDRVLSAELLSYKIKNPVSLMSSLKELTDDDLSFLSKVNTREDVIRLVHG